MKLRSVHWGLVFLEEIGEREKTERANDVVVVLDGCAGRCYVQRGSTTV